MESRVANNGGPLTKPIADEGAGGRLDCLERRLDVQLAETRALAEAVGRQELTQRRLQESLLRIEAQLQVSLGPSAAVAPLLAHQPSRLSILSDGGTAAGLAQGSSLRRPHLPGLRDKDVERARLEARRKQGESTPRPTKADPHQKYATRASCGSVHPRCFVKEGVGRVGCSLHGVAQPRLSRPERGRSEYPEAPAC